jgi:hypothetical protein
MSTSKPIGFPCARLALATVVLSAFVPLGAARWPWNHAAAWFNGAPSQSDRAGPYRARFEALQPKLLKYEKVAYESDVSDDERYHAARLYLAPLVVIRGNSEWVLADIQDPANADRIIAGRRVVERFDDGLTVLQCPIAERPR